MKWSFIAKPEGVPRHLVCNADESEPGTFKDRYLMEFLPHLLLEGLLISSYALGSNDTYIYIRGEYAWVADILEEAIVEATKNGWLGKTILFDVNVLKVLDSSSDKVDAILKERLPVEDGKITKII